MRIIILLIFITTILSVDTLSAQFNRCDSLILYGHYAPFNVDGVRTLRDYLNKYWSQYEAHFSDRKSLQQIPLLINERDEASFGFITSEGVKDDLVVLFGEKPFKGIDYFYPKDSSDLYSRIINADDAPYGITSEDTVVTFIEQIQVNGIHLPDSAFSDLLNPNRYKTFLSIKPIEMYKSQDGAYYYLYIFGDHRTDVIPIEFAYEFSYMAKLIIRKDGSYVGRIVESARILQYFGFGDCPDLIGF